MIAASSTRESNDQLSRGQTSLCAKCARPLTDEIAVSLWDARTYCEACVESECPGMVQIARSGEPLHEEMPEEFNSSLPRSSSQLRPFRRILRIAEVFLAFVAWGSGLAIGVGVALALVMFDLAFGLLVYHLLRPFVRSRPPLPWVHLEAGYIVFGRGQTVGAAVPLAECRWHELKAEGAPWGAIPPDGLLLIYGFPGVWPSPKKIAFCGFSSETKAYWQGFLALAGVPRISG